MCGAARVECATVTRVRLYEYEQYMKRKDDSGNLIEFVIACVIIAAFVVLLAAIIAPSGGVMVVP